MSKAEIVSFFESGGRILLSRNFKCGVLLHLLEDIGHVVIRVLIVFFVFLRVAC